MLGETGCGYVCGRCMRTCDGEGRCKYAWGGMLYV